MDNTQTLIHSKEKRVHENEKVKCIEINISQCLSSTQEIEVPEDFEYDQDKLKEYVIEQIVLPSDCLETNGYYNWYTDDFCVSI